jgi:hypothetical protein
MYRIIPLKIIGAYSHIAIIRARKKNRRFVFEKKNDVAGLR